LSSFSGFCSLETVPKTPILVAIRLRIRINGSTNRFCIESVGFWLFALSSCDIESHWNQIFDSQNRCSPDEIVKQMKRARKANITIVIPTLAPRHSLCNSSAALSQNSFTEVFTASLHLHFTRIHTACRHERMGSTKEVPQAGLGTSIRDESTLSMKMNKTMIETRGSGWPASPDISGDTVDVAGAEAGATVQYPGQIDLSESRQSQEVTRQTGAERRREREVEIKREIKVQLRTPQVATAATMEAKRVTARRCHRVTINPALIVQQKTTKSNSSERSKRSQLQEEERIRCDSPGSEYCSIESRPNATSERRPEQHVQK
jgi:hypothetical protein